MARITATGISKRYGGFSALSGIDLEIAEGEFLTLLGPSGSGKTTFLMILAGFVDPSAGRLTKNDLDIGALPAEKRNFGMVFQGYALFPHLSARQNIEYPLRVRGLVEAERRRRADRMIETVGLGAHADKKPSQLSGGQQQRVALARALVFDPDLLLLDEPLSALDRNMREQLQAELKRVHRETGTTFVFVTHDQGEALALSDKIAIFNRGRLVQTDNPEGIYNAPASRFVAEFLGRINIIPLTSPARDGATLRGRFAGETLSAPLCERSLRAGANAPGNLSLGIRPEHMTLSREKPNHGANALQVRVRDLTYQGASTNLLLSAFDKVTLSVTMPNSVPEGPPRPGEQLWVSWPMEQGRLLTDE